jgi:hypothetical protein
MRLTQGIAYEPLVYETVPVSFSRGKSDIIPGCIHGLTVNLLQSSLRKSKHVITSHCNISTSKSWKSCSLLIGMITEYCLELPFKILSLQKK